MAAQLLQVYYDTDVSEMLPTIRARTAVLHREGDRGARFSLGRQVAALIPDAEFVPLPGTSHLYYHGDWESVLDAVLDFLAEPSAQGLLTGRELQVAALIARGSPTTRSRPGSGSRRGPRNPTSRTSGASCRCARGHKSPRGRQSAGCARDVSGSVVVPIPVHDHRQGRPGRHRSR